jgi:ParB family transcriptional regulator, chromosome partitioning protein
VARKNLLASVTKFDAPQESEARAEYTRRGASRSMLISIDELAENAKKMADGEVIVSLDAGLIDGSFVSDRIDEDEEDYDRLRDAIKAQGQLTPVLVRPHGAGRYMIVYGHRRVRVARELGVPVRAVVKNLEDIAHIIAQGQENTARANLSFIEKALFGKKLLDMGQSKDTIKAALTIDDTLLSRMLSVAETVPASVLDAIGAARTVGRDRWEDLKKLVQNPAKAEDAKAIVRSEDFLQKEGADRFNFLLAELKAGRRRLQRKAGATSWVPEDRLVAADIRNTGKSFSLSLRSKHAGEFGEYISSNLERLYAAFKAAKARNE